MTQVQYNELVVTIIFALILVVYFLFSALSKKDSQELMNINKIQSVDLIQMSPPNLKVYHSINKYAPMNDVPFNIGFGIVREETGYKNPLDYTYNHSQTSPTGAEGPCQFIMSTAKWVANDNSLTRKEVRNNVELNVKLSMEYSHSLYKRYNSWNIALGYYNTGYPVVNSYALRITT